MNDEGDSDVLRGDGRRATIRCSACENESLDAEIDPVDATVYLHCGECARDVLVGQALRAQISIRTTVESIDDLDPKVRALLNRESTEVEPGGASGQSIDSHDAGDGDARESDEDRSSGDPEVEGTGDDLPDGQRADDEDERETDDEG